MAMPLFAYRCSDCAHQFETLSRFDEIPECPACGGAHVER
jgi:putative FmdB family regulatory protein